MEVEIKRRIMVMFFIKSREVLVASFDTRLSINYKVILWILNYYLLYSSRGN